jgi:hypothetical protein
MTRRIDPRLPLPDRRSPAGPGRRAVGVDLGHGRPQIIAGGLPGVWVLNFDKVVTSSEKPPDSSGQG